jgi:hypothetical protein
MDAPRSVDAGRRAAKRSASSLAGNKCMGENVSAMRIGPSIVRECGRIESGVNRASQGHSSAARAPSLSQGHSSAARAPSVSGERHGRSTAAARVANRLKGRACRSLAAALGPSEPDSSAADLGLSIDPARDAKKSKQVVRRDRSTDAARAVLEPRRGERLDRSTDGVRGRKASWVLVHLDRSTDGARGRKA